MRLRKQETQKKPKNTAAIICAALLVTAGILTGCGESDIEEAERSPILENADETTALPGNQGEKQNENQTENSQDEEVKEENLLSENGDSQEDVKLTGIVVSVGKDSIVVNETLAQESDGVLFASASGENITVYFSENAGFVFQTVKNSGMNEETDVETREGSFADIRENITVEMTGFYREGDFIAEQVVISEFI